MLLLLTGVMCMAISFTGNKITNQEYGTSTIDKFNGVDKTTTPTEVDPTRAIDMSNYLPDGNSLVKRHGVKQVKSSQLENGKLINFCYYKNNKIYYYECDETVNDTTYNRVFIIETETNNSTSINRVYKNSISFARNFSSIEYEGKLFILCDSGYYLFDGTTLTNLVDYDNNSISYNTYIPTRYIIPTYDSNLEKDTNTAMLEDINIATNKFCVRTLPLASTKLNLKLNPLYSVNALNPSSNWGVIYVELEGYIDLSEYSKYVPALSLTSAKLDLTECSEKTQDSSIQIPMTWDTNKKMYKIKATFTEDEEVPSASTGDCPVWLNGGTSDIEKDIAEVSKVIQNAELKFYFIDNSVSIKITDFKYFKPFGTDGYTDRLFLYGNPNYPNLDIHSGYASQSNDRWKDYTYFPDSSYQTLGSSDSAITGYGILSNGAMAIFKQSKENEPNLFFRTAVNATKMASDGTIQSTMYGVDEYYPITRSGVNIGSDYFEQVIQFGNDLLINTPSGLYRIDVGTSTATQTYYAKEVSYFLRNEWSSDITGSIHCVYDNKLFIKRKNKDGKYRIYVADMNRYSFKDSIQQYEWWILDGIDVDVFKVIENELYMVNDIGIYQFGTDFVDEDFIAITDVQVGDTFISSELFIDTDDDKCILSPSNYLIEKISNSSEKYNEWLNFKENTILSINNNDIITDIAYEVKIREIVELDEINKYKLAVIDCSSEQLELLNQLITVVVTGVPLSDGLNTFVAKEIEYEYDENNKLVPIITVETQNVLGTVGDSLQDIVLHLNTINQQYYDYYIKELYTDVDIDDDNCYDFSHIEKNNDKFYYVNNVTGQFVELPNTTLFNVFDVGIMVRRKKYTLDLDLNSSELTFVALKQSRPVKAYWYSCLDDCGHIEYLKTANYLYFVPETKRGGLTHIGYRTNKKEVGYDARYFTKQLDFNDIDFEDFGFGELEFGHSISSKKKIKNFSFIQLIAYSYEPKDSTLAQITYRYKYTKNNKGVK